MSVLGLSELKCLCEMLPEEDGDPIIISVACCINNGLAAVHRVSPVINCGFWYTSQR